MGLSCGMSMVKYGLFVFNLICAIAGIALIVVGALPLYKLEHVRDALPDHEPATVPIIVLVLGSIIFIISFFGCCGAIKESPCMVSTYTWFLLLLVIIQVILAVFAFMYTEDLANAAEKGFTNLWNEMDSGTERNSSERINSIQSHMHCCGKQGPNDWLNDGRPIRPSCCSSGLDTCNINSTDLFHEGCGPVLFDLVNASGLLIAWIAIVFGAFELVGVVFGCCLGNSIRNTARRQYA